MSIGELTNAEALTARLVKELGRRYPNVRVSDFEVWQDVRDNIDGSTVDWWIAKWQDRLIPLTRETLLVHVDLTAAVNYVATLIGSEEKDEI